MRLRFLLFVALAGLALPVAARADDKAAGPSLVIQLKSIDGLLADARYFAALADREDDVKNFQEMVQKFSKEKEGFNGIDTKRPFAVYGSFDPNNPLGGTVVALIPIADEKAFVGLLGNYNVKAEKGSDGVYTVDNIPGAPIPVSLYFRVENKYAYVTAMEKSNIDKNKLLAPEKVLPAAGDNAIISLKLKLAELPDIVKQMAVQGLETKLSEAKDQKPPKETEAIRKLRESIIDNVGKQVATALNEGDELTVKVVLNPKRDDINVNIDLTAKPDSAFAKDLKKLSDARSVFAGLATAKAALSFAGHVVLPEELKKLVGPAVDDAIKQAIEQAQEENRNLAKAALETLAPTLKSGEFDGGVAVFGPDKNGFHTVVAGIKLTEGKGIEDFGRSIIKIVPEKDKDKIQLDADSVGDVKIHKLAIRETADANAKRIFGSSDAYLAIRHDAAYLAYGPDALKEIKQLISASAGSIPLLQFDAALARVLPWDVKNKDVQKHVKEIFGSEIEGKDAVHVRVEGGSSLKITLTAKGKSLALGNKLQSK
ncbi:MAG TPA: hypothetical protein VGZ47_15115 [Gemmataceae bacterium]|jgi:hypothetical protein|nr:hypothetical protein [Gemmataceae bacterium]